MDWVVSTAAVAATAAAAAAAPPSNTPSHQAVDQSAPTPPANYRHRRATPPPPPSSLSESHLSLSVLVRRYRPDSLHDTIRARFHYQRQRRQVIRAGINVGIARKGRHRGNTRRPGAASRLHADRTPTPTNAFTPTNTLSPTNTFTPSKLSRQTAPPPSTPRHPAFDPPL
jgi:hypothetical protein